MVCVPTSCPTALRDTKKLAISTLQAAARPIPSKGTVTIVFSWPATNAVYAAITFKVKNKPNEKRMTCARYQPAKYD